MPTVVCLGGNIYDEHGEKHLRGAAFDASDEFVKMVLDGDEAAEREPRITVIEAVKKRKPRAENADS